MPSILSMHGRNHLPNGSDPIPGLNFGTPFAELVASMATASDLLGYWRLGGGVSPWADTSGHAYGPADMTLDSQGTAMTMLLTPGALPATQDDGAVSFNNTAGGSADYLEGTDPAPRRFNFGTANVPFTLAVWVKPGTSASTFDGIIIGQWRDAGFGDCGWRLGINWPGRTVFMQRKQSGSSPTSSTVTSPGGLVADEWAFVVASYSDTLGSKLYVNGLLVASDATVFSTLPAFNQGPNIGGRLGSSESFYGGVDEATVWGTTLTPADILALATAGGASGTGSGILVYAGGIAPITSEAINFSDASVVDFTVAANTGIDGVDVTAGLNNASVTEAKLLMADNTTANATTSAHGFLKKLSNVATEFMNGVGNWVTLASAAVTSIKKTGSAALVGDVTLSQGANVTLTQTGQDITIAATVTGGGAVDSIAVQGDTPMVGDIEFIAGSGITLTQDDTSTLTIAAGANDGWVDDTAATWTRTADQTFTVTGDRTAVFAKGTRLRWTQTTVKYGTVVASSHSAGTTTVTIATTTDYVLTAAAISLNYYSYAATPQGYPTWFAWTPTIAGISGGTSIDFARFCVVGKAVTVSFGFTATSNATTMTATLPIPNTFTTPYNITPCLVANNNLGILAAAGRVDTFATGVLRFGLTCTAAGGFTASNTKGAYGQITYEMA